MLQHRVVRACVLEHPPSILRGHVLFHPQPLRPGVHRDDLGVLKHRQRVHAGELSRVPQTLALTKERIRVDVKHHASSTRRGLGTSKRGRHFDGGLDRAESTPIPFVSVIT